MAEPAQKHRKEPVSTGPAEHRRQEPASAGPAQQRRMGPLQTLKSYVTSPAGTGWVPNLVVTLVCQALSCWLALGLDALGFPDATVVIVFVIGVLFTAILTVGWYYSLLASIISILLYNFFLIAPRFSLVIEGRSYAGTISAMLLFALTASFLVESMRSNARASMEASLVAEREQMRANMLRSISHDLRTPLTSISGNADMLLDEGSQLSDATRRMMLQDIYDDATWLTTVVQNLLAITRIEDGSVRFQMDVELVDDVIEEAMRHISRNAQRHHITVVPSSQMLLARMDPQVIVQVIVNLINNAITHTQEGSYIVISTWREGGHVAISVADNGPGIDDAEKQHVFESFYTATAQSQGADVGRSVGLGLSLCRSIVEAHGGTIYLKDVDPHGANFVFTLPIEEVPLYV